VLDVALEIPLRPLAFGGGRKGDDACEAGVQGLHDPLDRAALARRVAPLEDDDDLQATRLDPLLPLDQLDVEALKLRLVLLPGKAVGARFGSAPGVGPPG
jgi:hypothetical protein